MQPGDGALLAAFVGAEANARQLGVIDKFLHRLWPADPAQQPVVGGVVAASDRAVEQVGVIGAEAAAAADQFTQRLVEQRQILGPQLHRFGEIEAALIDFVERRQRDPQFGHALLRKKRVAIGVEDAASGNVLHRQPCLAIEAIGQREQLFLERALIGIEHHGQDHRGARPGLGFAGQARQPARQQRHRQQRDQHQQEADPGRACQEASLDRWA